MMVSKRRIIKSGTPMPNKEHIPPTLMEHADTLKEIMTCSNPIAEEFEMIDLEASLLSSSKLPILTLSASDVKPKKIPKAKNNHEKSWIHLLPHSDSLKNNANSNIHNYVYIPLKKKRRSNSTLQSSNNINSTISHDEPFSRLPVAQEAIREASVLQQIGKLTRQGLWSATRLPKIMEPQRFNTHWDYLLEEARWMATDFNEERKWKMEAAKKLAYSARVFCIIKKELQLHENEVYERRRRDGAAIISYMVRQWWNDVSNTVTDSILFENQRNWRATLKENRRCIAEFTDINPNWLSNAVSHPLCEINIDANFERTSKAIDKHCFNDSEDPDWASSVASVSTSQITSNFGMDSSSTSSSRAASFESLNFAEAGNESTFDFQTQEKLPSISPYSLENFSWGLPLTSPAPIDISKNESKLKNLEGASNLIKIEPSPSLSHITMEKGDIVADKNRVSSEVLEPSISNGLPPIESPDSKIPLLECILSSLPSPLESNEYTNSYVISNDTEKIRRESEVSTLLLESSLPLEQLLPQGYQPISLLNLNLENKIDDQSPTLTETVRELRSSRNAKQSPVSKEMNTPVSRVLRKNLPTRGLLNGVSSRSNPIEYPRNNFISSKPSSPSPPNLSSFQSDPASDKSCEFDISDSFESVPSSLSSLSSTGKFTEVSQRLTVPPWYTSDPCDHSEPLTPRQLRKLAREISSIKKERLPPCLPYILPSFGPTCRIPFLPTASLYAAVAWLHASYNKRIPACLLSPIPSSSDAELTLAAHLGQLAVLRPVSSSSSMNGNLMCQPVTGDWGPHLIVCPRVLLPAWRHRLASFCPGLRVVCISGGSSSAGTGRRLRRSISGGQVNICLTSFSALRSRPSRYASIKWSLVILDQAQHLTCRCQTVSHDADPFCCDTHRLSSSYTHKNENGYSSDFSSVGDFSKDANYVNSTTKLCSTLNYKTVAHSIDKRSGKKETKPISTSVSSSAALPELVELIIDSLSSARQRILIYSADLPLGLSNVQTLFHLLLTSKNASDVMLKDNSHSVGHPGYLKRSKQVKEFSATLSRGEVIKMLDPFIFRFDEDDDWDLFVKERIISNALLDQQRIIHDLILTDKSCQRAIKSGSLVDFLSTVSAGARVCIHPCLAGSDVGLSDSFYSCINGLRNDCSPAPGPLRFPLLSHLTKAVFCSPLSFSTAPDVLNAVRHLRESESVYPLSEVLSLGNTNSSPSHTGRRLVELLTDTENIEKQFPSPSSNGVVVSTSVLGYELKHIRQPLFVLSPEYHLNGLKRSSGTSVEFLTSNNKKRPRLDNYPFDSKSSTILKLLNDALPYQDRDQPVSLPFINQDMFNVILLEESAKLSYSEILKSTSSDLHNGVNIKSEPSLQKLRMHSLISKTSSMSGKKLALGVSAEQLPYESGWKHLTSDELADWCCNATCEYIRRLIETPSVDEFYSSSIDELAATDYAFPRHFLSHLLNVVRVEYEKICDSSPSAMMNLICTRHPVIASPPLLNTPFRFIHEDKPQTNDMLSNKGIIPKNLKDATELLYPLLSSSRWLNRNASPNIRASLLFTASSGKFQALQRLLRQLTCCSSEFSTFLPNIELNAFENGSKTSVFRRPRCVFLIAHRTAFLKLLQVWLSSHPDFASFSCIRFPSDHLGGDKEELINCVEHLNNWTAGSRGPLFALIHARAPLLSLAGLRAGPDTRVIICDTDWRYDVVDSLRTRLRTWALNGIVDSPLPSRCNFSSSNRLKGCELHEPLPLLYVYRLVTDADNGDSMEACLSETALIHLLPGSVFTNSPSTTSSKSSPFLARVQPNIVQDLLTNLNRQALHRLHSKSSLDLTSLCRVCKSHADNSSKLDDVEDDSDTTSLFHNRAPVSEDLLNGAFEMFESPQDVQAWYSSSAETLSIKVELYSCPRLRSSASVFHPPLHPESNHFDSELIYKGCEFWNSSNQRDSSLMHCLSGDSLASHLGYSAFDSWEITHFDQQQFADSLKMATCETNEIISYSPDFLGDTNYDSESPSSILPELPVFELSELPLWLPPNCCDVPLLGDRTLPIGVSSPVVAEEPWMSTIWGYSSETMSEQELPPISYPASILNFNFAPTTSTIPLYSDTLNKNLSAQKKFNGERKRPAPSALLRKAITSDLRVLKRRKFASRRVIDFASIANSGSEFPDKGVAVVSSNQNASSKPASPQSFSEPVPPLASPSSPTTELSMPPPLQSPQIGNPTLDSNNFFVIPLPAASNTDQIKSHHHSLYIPRPFYNRGPHLRIAKVRRPVGPGGIRQSSSSGMMTHSALNNPALLAKYTVFPINTSTLANRQLSGTGSSQRQSTAVQMTNPPLGLTASKLNSATSITSNLSTQIASSGLSTGKPPDWSLNEEAGLFQCVSKLQQIPLNPSSVSPDHSACTPNFNLAEYFLNNYSPTTAFRSCRQCLLVFFKAQATISAANAAMSSAATHGEFSGEGNCAPVEEISSSHSHPFGTHHGVVGRKSKNKLRPTFSSSSLISASATQVDDSTNPPGLHPTNFSNSSTFSRLKGYQFYQYLNSLIDSCEESGLSVSSSLGAFMPSPQNVGEMITAVRSAIDNQSALLQKVIQETLITDGPSYSSSSSVISGSTGGGSSHRSFLSSLSPAPSYGQSASSLHSRYHGVSASTNLIGAVSGLIVVSSSSSAGTGILSGPVIQKNPTHFAALQEHNISPDTLITPAIVIKNKEERESRMRAESCSTVPTASSISVPINSVFAPKKQQITMTSSHSNVLSVSSAIFPAFSAAASSSTIAVPSMTQRSTGISPFSSSTAYGNIHVSGSMAPTGSTGAAVLRYATPLNLNVSGGQHKILHQPGTGLLRRVGSAVSVDFLPSVSGNTHQQLYTVPNSAILTATGSSSGGAVLASRISAYNPAISSEMAVISSTGHVISPILPISAASLVHRSGSLTSVGSSSPSNSVIVSFGTTSISPSINTSGSGITMIASSRSLGGPPAIFQAGGHPSSTGVTLITGNKVSNRSPNQIPQIFRPRNALRNSTVAHKFVRTVSTGAGHNMQLTGSSGDNQPNGGRFLGASVPSVIGLQHGPIVHRGGRDNAVFKHIIRSQSGDNHNSHNFISLNARQRIFPAIHSSVHTNNNNSNSILYPDDADRGVGTQLQNSSVSVASPRNVSDLHLLSNMQSFYKQRSQTGGTILPQSVQRSQPQFQPAAFNFKGAQCNAMYSQRNNNSTSADHNQNPPSQTKK